MYRDAPGERFAAGSVASGIDVARLLLVLRRGRDREPFFDTYVLLSNPGDLAATVTAQYASRLRSGRHDDGDARSTGPYVVAPHRRLTLWAAQRGAAAARHPAERTHHVHTAHRRRAHPVVAAADGGDVARDPRRGRREDRRPPLGRRRSAGRCSRPMAGTRSCWWRRRSRICANIRVAVACDDGTPRHARHRPLGKPHHLVDAVRVHHRRSGADARRPSSRCQTQRSPRRPPSRPGEHRLRGGSGDVSRARTSAPAAASLATRLPDPPQ